MDDEDDLAFQSTVEWATIKSGKTLQSGGISVFYLMIGAMIILILTILVLYFANKDNQDNQDDQNDQEDGNYQDDMNDDDYVSENNLDLPMNN